MTGRTGEENILSPIEIVPHLLKALAHVALHQLGTHEAGKLLLALNSRVYHAHIAVHGGAEHDATGFQHKGGNGGKCAAGGGAAAHRIVLVPHGEHRGIGAQLPTFQGGADVAAMPAENTGLRDLGV